MNQKGSINIILIIIVFALVGVGAYFVATRQIAPTPVPTPIHTPSPSPTLTPKPSPKPSPKPISINCTSDSQCPTNYICEATQRVSTVCAMNSNGQPVDPHCVPTSTIIKGSCKVKQGYSCSTSADCVAGNLCRAGTCTSPIEKVCSYSGDPICGPDYQCIQDCGPPVSQGDEPPPGWHCILNEEAVKPRTCPICLAGDTLIDTPSGFILVKDLQVGMSVWTMNKAGQRVAGVVTKTSKVPVPLTHQMVYLVLDDGRELYVSPGHTTIDGRTIGDLVPGKAYDGATIASITYVPYSEGATYDLLPSGDTGFYWANGILIDSTLR
jgi:hypothetical protein